MKLKFTRKTWYFFLLAAAAVSMLGGFAVLRDAGCLDYKNGLLPGSLWLVGILVDFLLNHLF